MNAKTTLHIFKPGKQTAMSGVTLEFSEADLEASARAYDPALHEAPITVGHPKHDLPAYGWVKGLSAAADGLHADPHQVDPAFAELVEAGRFKKVSASFYTPDSPSNPVPGVYYLRHVAFLGALPPAVKGLKAVAFGEAEEGVIEFGELPPSTVGRLFRGLRDFFLAKYGQEDADRALPPYEIDWLQEQIAQPDSSDGKAWPASFSESSDAPAGASPADSAGRASHVTPEPGAVAGGAPQPDTNLNKEPTVDPAKAAALESENQQLKTKLAALEAQATADAAAKRHADNLSYAEGLVGAGKLCPKDRAAIVALLDFAAAPTAEGGVLEFGEGDAKQALSAGLKGFLDGLPKVVDFGEHATKDKAAPSDAGADHVDYGENVDQDRLALDQKIRAYAAEHKVDYATAASRVIK